MGEVKRMDVSGKRVLIGIQGLIYDTDAEPELDEPGNEFVYPDRGEVLVIQRVLNVAVSKSVDDNSWLRNNIFRTMCTSKGKIYDMIIDGGSCENVVSIYMVEKLGMKTEDHPEPYQLIWLKKRNTVKVSKRFLVQFSIEENEIISEAPLQVQPLLRKFADVIPYAPWITGYERHSTLHRFYSRFRYPEQISLSDESEGVCGASETSD
ncbi:hypothetical protein Tco_0117723 [Tanacetum coccineum]